MMYKQRLGFQPFQLYCHDGSDIGGYTTKSEMFPEFFASFSSGGGTIDPLRAKTYSFMIDVAHLLQRTVKFIQAAGGFVWLCGNEVVLLKPPSDSNRSVLRSKIPLSVCDVMQYYISRV